MTSISLNVNGKSHDLEIEDNTLLVTALREHLGLTGTHVGCDTSQCGCCVVRLNGESVKSCTTLAIQAKGGKVLTVEGLSVNGELHPPAKGIQGQSCTAMWILYARHADVSFGFDRVPRTSSHT